MPWGTAVAVFRELHMPGVFEESEDPMRGPTLELGYREKGEDGKMQENLIIDGQILNTIRRFGKVLQWVCFVSVTGEIGGFFGWGCSSLCICLCLFAPPD